jgi:putative PIN family toxin of toxin-antitoxin system
VRVFFDTNVLVSAFASRGICADLLEVVLLEHELIVGSSVLTELERALRQKVKLPANRAKEIVDFISGEASLLVPDARPFTAAIDADDAMVIGEALQGMAEIFVTGDAALVRLAMADRLPIVSPRQFWEALHSRPR